MRKIWGPACQRRLQVVAMHSGALLSVASEAADAFLALDRIMYAHGYAPRAADTGAFNCRRITGGRAFSLHAYGIAADINWNSNPYRADNRLVTDMPPAMVASIKAIRTTSGAPVFRWGGDYRSIKDPMHYEIVASRLEIRSGIDWATVSADDSLPSDSLARPVAQIGAQGPVVGDLQQLLQEAGFPIQADDLFGPQTFAAVEEYQKSRGLDVDGVVGRQTWTALLTDQPSVEYAKSPVKITLRAPDTHPSTRRTLKISAKGLDVSDLQRRLKTLGFKPGKEDGVFGRRTLKAVKEYQASRSLETDGIVGRRTWTALLRST